MCGAGRSGKTGGEPAQCLADVPRERAFVCRLLQLVRELGELLEALVEPPASRDTMRQRLNGPLKLEAGTCGGGLGPLCRWELHEQAAKRGEHLSHERDRRVQ